MSVVTSSKPKITARPSAKAAAQDTVSEVSYLGKTIEETYKDKELEEHILSDPDTYAGSIEPQEEEVWCVSEESGNMYKTRIKFIECFYKLFDEILVNSIDQHKRIAARLEADPNCGLKPVKRIAVNVDETNGVISVENDGEGLDVAIHPKFGLYVPEVVFGSLLTSINYDNTEERTVGGKNGYGAKITNIFSKEFTVETVDWRRKLHYAQTFRNNMKVVEKPVITTYTKVPFTRITYKPDFARFNVRTPAEMEDWKMIRKRVYDASACTDKSVQVVLDGKKIAVKEFEDYINLYIGHKTETKRVYSKVNDRWEVSVCLSNDGDFEQVSFVNGICTDRGGRHVNHIIDNLAKKIAVHITEKDKKKIDIKPAFIKQNLFVFVQSTIVNPKFDTQTKRKLVSNVESFGSRCELDDDFVSKVVKLGILERATKLAEFKAKQGLDKKTDGNARARKVYHPKLVEGACAGPNRPKGTITTIVFTEGDSAAGFMGKGLKGIPDSQHKYWSYFPLRGKLLNIRTATMKQLEANEEIMMIKKIIGLKDGETYTDTKQLRYDRVMILTDADKDGFHIKGLIMNFFSHKWPSLLKLKGFICDVSTPINKAIKVDARNNPVQSLEFYSEREYHDWAKATNTTGWNIKYYKGLGTYSPAEAKALCANMRLSNYTWTDGKIEYKSQTKDETAHQFELVFAKKFEDERKEWLNDGHEPNPFAITQGSNGTISYLGFLNNHQKLFSQADNVRSIPSIMDGLKPSQRKVLFCAMKRNLVKDIKVSQFSGYISEHGAYHHGEAALEGTIVNMAQDYVGHSNYNLLFPSGNFGSRMGGGPELKKGEDAAASRYIFTYMNHGTKILFNPVDTPLLEQQEDEGLQIEPKFFAPVLPTVLINGATGIGTGYSTTVQCYNPIDIIENIRRYLKGEPLQPMIPWYRGYNGKIIQLGSNTDNRFITVGKWTRTDKNTIRVTELPVGTNMCKSYKGYIQFLNTLLDQDSSKKAAPAPAAVKKPVKKDEDAEDDAKDDASTRSQQAAFKEAVLLDYEIIKATDTDLIVDLIFKQDVLDRELENNEDYHFEKKIKLAFTFTTNNMHLYDVNGIIKKYATTEDIIREFCETRAKYYGQRRALLLEQNRNEYSKVSSQYRFITEIMNDTMDIKRKPKKEVEQMLSTASPPYPKYEKTRGLTTTDAITAEDEDDETKEAEASKGDYNYLLNLPVSSFTQEKLDRLKAEADKYQEICARLDKQTGEDLWNIDIDAFSVEYKAELEAWVKRNSLMVKEQADPAVSFTMKAKPKAAALKQAPKLTVKAKPKIPLSVAEDDEE
jgi:DNA topoisomerase-2